MGKENHGNNTLRTVQIVVLSVTIALLTAVVIAGLALPPRWRGTGFRWSIGRFYEDEARRLETSELPLQGAGAVAVQYEAGTDLTVRRTDGDKLVLEEYFISDKAAAAPTEMKREGETILVENTSCTMDGAYRFSLGPIRLAGGRDGESRAPRRAVLWLPESYGGDLTVTMNGPSDVVYDGGAGRRDAAEDRAGVQAWKGADSGDGAEDRAGAQAWKGTDSGDGAGHGDDAERQSRAGNAVYNFQLASGDLCVSHFVGKKLSFDCKLGDVELSDIDADIDGVSDSGDLALTGLGKPGGRHTYRLRGRLGDCELSEVYGESADITLSSGDLSAEHIDASLRASLSLGDAEIHDFGGGLTVESRSGDITVSGIRLPSYAFCWETSSGDVEFETDDDHETLFSSLEESYAEGYHREDKAADPETLPRIALKTSLGDISVEK